MVRRKGFPEVKECVIVTVKRITPYAAWCQLEEYPGREGMIHVSEVAGKWVRDIRKFVKLEKTYVAKVLRVDKKRGHINLSLKRVDRLDKRKKMQEFKLEQRAEKMLEVAARDLNKTLEQAYEEVGYKLQDMFGSLHAAFEEASKSKKIEGIPTKWSKKMHEIALKGFEEKEKTLTAELNLICFEPDGIKKIKSTLLELEKNGLKVRYVSAPRYRVELTTKDPKLGEKKIRTVLEKIIKTFPGEASFKMVS